MDEQHNYQQYYQTPPQEPAGKPKRKFFRIWGPLFIKLLIVYAISVVFTAVIMGQYFQTTIGLDAEAIREFMAVEENYNKVFYEIMQQSVQYTTVMEGLAALVTIPILIFMFRKDRAMDKLAGIVPVKKEPLWKYSAVVLMAVALCMGINNLFFISNLSSLSALFEETMEALYTPSLAIQIVCLGILIPVCEELVFRGLMYKRMREYSGFVFASVYTALVFAFAHVNLVQAIYGFAMAIVFAFLYEKYGSVKAPIAAHIAANVFSVLATHFKLFDWIMAEPMRAGGLTVACATIAASMYVFIQRMDEENE